MPRPSAPEPPRAGETRDPDGHYLLAADGTPVHYYFWPADADASGRPDKPPVLIVHGAGEHGGRYRELAAFLNSAGYPVAAIDLRGFGRSGGPRAYIGRFEDYLRDLEAVGAQTLKLVTADRLHLLGHSMGGLTAAVAAASGRPSFLASLTLSSPCFRLSFPVPAHLRAVGAVCSAIAPTTLFATKAVSQILTHDPQKAQEHRDDPRIVHFMSARLFFEMQAQMARYRGLAARIRIPTAVFQAGEDKVVDRRASREFFEAVDVPGKRWTEYPGGYHEIINETFRSQVHRDILAFLDSI